MNKHAYCIMAYNEWPILEKLLSLLDDERHDFFIHIDSRAMDFNPSIVTSNIKKSNCFFLKSRPVYWADYSLTDTEIDLLALAHENGNYSYYHLLSGTDLPIKSNDEIYTFFESQHKNFIGIVPRQYYYSVRRIKFYHFLLQNKWYRNSKILKCLDRLMEYFQVLVGINRLRGENMKVIDGWQWCSIMNEFCEYILSKRSFIEKHFKYSIASDELVMQTMAYNSHFFASLYDSTDLCNGSMREIDWKRGSPYIWGGAKSDLKILEHSKCMFARKFSTDYPQIIDCIYKKIKDKSCSLHTHIDYTNQNESELY